MDEATFLRKFAKIMILRNKNYLKHIERAVLFIVRVLY